MLTRTLAFVLFQTSRPSQLLLILGVYLFGALVALGQGATLQVETLALAAVPLVLASASVHYANEFADYETDALTTRTPFSGGSGALVETGTSRWVPLYAGLLSLTLALLVTGIFLATDGVTTTATAVLVGATVLGWQYSVGPLKLAWRGWGEVTNATLGGLLLPVYGAAVLDGPLLEVALASIPFFLVVLLNLFATQWPDREADATVGKRTLAVQWSRHRCRVAYATIALGAALSLALLHSSVLTPAVLPTAVVLGSVPIAPLVVWGVLGYTERDIPWPTVSAMVGLLTLQCLAWLWVLQ